MYTRSDQAAESNDGSRESVVQNSDYNTADYRSNDYDNGIYVICDPDEDNIRYVDDYLKRLGLEIVYKEDCVVVQPDEVFNDDDLDVALIDW